MDAADGVGLGESFRIIETACKIQAHLSSSLTYCLTYPRSLDVFRSVMSILAFDMVDDTKIECMKVDFEVDYYVKVKAAAFGPLYLVGAVLAGGLVHTAYTHFSSKQQRLRRTLSALNSPHHSISKAHSASVLTRLMWAMMHPLLFSLDLVYPAITRTLLSFFLCRDLGSAGLWLEADYGISCDPERNEWYGCTHSCFALL